MSSESVIILCGGASTRMGSPKALLKINKKTWLEYQIARMRELDFSNITVVLGYSAKEILKHVTLTNINVVINKRPERGQFSSLQEGLLKTNDEYNFILPIDVPVPDRAVWDSLRTYKPYDVIQPECNGLGGHPLLISLKFKNKLLAQPSSYRLDFLIREEKKLKRVWVADKKVLMNLNTLEDFEEFKKLC